MALYFIVPLSGPVNGVKVLSKYIVDSIDPSPTIIDTAQAATHDDHGKLRWKKIGSFLKLLKSVSKIPPRSKCYLNLTPRGFAFIRDIIFLTILNLKNCNSTVHVHANGLELRNNFLLKLALKKNKVIVINKDQKRKLNFLPKLFLIPNALPNYNKDSFEDLWKKRNKKQILYFSNLSIDKGFYEAVQIFKQCAEREILFEFVMVGGVLDKEIMKDITLIQEKHKNFKYYPSITDINRKTELFSAASVFLFTSKPNYEVYPLVLIEALMFGLPIVSTRQIVSEEVITNKNGLVIDSKDRNLAEAANFITNLVSNEEKLKSFSLNSFQLYQNNYNFNSFVNHIMNVIHN